MKVVVIGGSGLLGSKLVEMLARSGNDVIATYNSTKPVTYLRNVKWVRLNLLERVKVEDLILKARPDVVVHLAAYTDVDGCETHKEHAWRVNVEGVKSVVRASRVVKAYLLYVSTDYVFDGEKGMYVEDDVPNPINYYGLTKLVAENVVSSSDILYTIIRTSAIYGVGPGKRNFAVYVVESLSQGREVRALIDQYVSPTYNTFLARAICEIIEARPMGVLHVAGPRMSRYEFALRLARIFALDENLVKPVRMNEMKWIAKRPRDSSLDTTRLRSVLGIDMGGIDDALRQFAQEYRSALGMH